MVGLVGAVALGVGSVVRGATAATARRGTPRLAVVPVVRRYLAALSSHDSAAACQTFSAALRVYIRSWDDSRSCTRAVDAAFAPGSRGHALRRVAVSGRVHLTHDRFGNLGVQARLKINAGSGQVVGRADIFWLRSFAGRWQFVKPGAIYNWLAPAASPPGYDPESPPGDRATVSKIPTLPTAPILCPAGGTSAVNHARSLQPEQLDPGARAIPVAAAPWLNIKQIHAVWLARDQLCVTITLAAAPRPAISYSLDVQEAINGGSEEDLYGIQIDGTGGVQTRLTDHPADHRHAHRACPTGYGYTNGRLTLIASPSDRAVDLTRRLSIQAYSASLQLGEPLLRHPLNAEQTVPSRHGLLLPAPPGHARRCKAL